MGDSTITRYFWLLILLILFSSCTKVPEQEYQNEINAHHKVYWLIPDGFRADPDLFDIYELAGKGELPNIKRMMDRGAYGYSIPLFPSHTPVNYAALLTGSYPRTNGVADGPMHTQNRTLSTISISGFSSTAKKVDPIWVTAENQGAKVVLISLPGSTPPELEKGITIRGRWGGWGADYYALNFETRGNLSQRIMQGLSSRLFLVGPELTKYIDSNMPKDWSVMPKSFSPPKEIQLNGFGSVLYGYIYDSTNDNKTNYDRMRFSSDKKIILADIQKNYWSKWIPISLKWQNLSINSHMRIKIIKLEDNGFFRVRIIYDNLNEYIVDPSYVSEDLEQNIGPMVDFVDNFPPQLIYYPEDKQTFLEEMNMSLEWHTKAIPYIVKKYSPDFVIDSNYDPNQMLTSRWWLGYIDPHSKRYDNVNATDRAKLWTETMNMYKKIDIMVGTILNNTDNNTIIILSSDHGAIPLDRSVYLNDLFARKGWLKFKINESTGEPVIDWKNSTVIFLKMDNIYVNPNGLSGKWIRGSGEEYEKLRETVIQTLMNLSDQETDIKPLSAVVKWEDVNSHLELPFDRVGDLVIANSAGYGWSEEMFSDLKLFGTPKVTGYKQAVLANTTKGMWTPFIIMGPGIRTNHSLDIPIAQINQYPTIMKAAGYDIPEFVDGKPLNEIFIDDFTKK